MATKTLGTAATSTLTAIQVPWGLGGLVPSDVAAVGLFKDQPVLQANSNPLLSASYGGEVRPYQGWSQQSKVLFLPNGRSPGGIILSPGDWVAIDPLTGWPIVISGFAAANASFVHS
jgi:hypothetical protein